MRFILVLRAVEVLYGGELVHGVSISSELGEGEDIVSKIGEMLVGLLKKSKLAGMAHFFEDRTPGALSGEVLKVGDFVTETVQRSREPKQRIRLGSWGLA
jgi:hypothetical protein